MLAVAALTSSALAAFACGGGGGGGTEGSGGSGPVTKSCEADNFACGEGETCVLLEDHSPECVKSGSIPVGGECLTRKAEQCAAGLTCETFIDEAKGTCRQLCNDAHPCEEGAACPDEPDVYGLRYCSNSCLGMPFTCKPGNMCHSFQPGHAECLPPGPGAKGDFCGDGVSSEATCGEGLHCDEGRCAQVCDEQHACPNGEVCCPDFFDEFYLCVSGTTCE